MKSIKTIIIAITLLAMTAPAFADNQLIDSVIGLVAGGAAGRGMCRNCSQRNKNIATGVVGLGGAWVGSRIGDDSGTRHADQMAMQQRQLDQQQQQYNNSQSSYSNGSSYRPAQAVYVAQNLPVPASARYSGGYPDRTVTPVVLDVASQDRSPTVVIQTEDRHDRHPRGRSDVCGDEEYYHGQYNPEAAIALCKGRHDAVEQRNIEARKQMIEQAYKEGLEAGAE